MSNVTQMGNPPARRSPMRRDISTCRGIFHTTVMWMPPSHFSPPTVILCTSFASRMKMTCTSQY